MVNIPQDFQRTHDYGGCPTMADTLLVPGAWVRHPDHPDWGEGQVQSSINGRATVNFEERGKVVINTEIVALKIVNSSGRF